MLDEKLRSRHKMRNNSTQTDDFLTDAQIQTEQLRSLRPISSLFTNRSVEGEETDVNLNKIIFYKRKFRTMKFPIPSVNFHQHQSQNVVEVFIEGIIQCLML